MFLYLLLFKTMAIYKTKIELIIDPAYKNEYVVNDKNIRLVPFYDIEVQKIIELKNIVVMHFTAKVK